MKNIILAALFGTALTSTSVFGMEKWGDEYPYKKPLVMVNTSHAPSELEFYEAGKIDTQKGLGSSRDIWKPELEFLDSTKHEWITRDLLFAILDRGKDYTFFRNGKCLQIININCPFRYDFPDYYPSLCCNPLSQRDLEMTGWYFEGWKFDGSPIYFEIQELGNSKTKKIKGDDYSNDFDFDMNIGNPKKKRF